MSGYNNEEYENLVKDIIHDVFYTDSSRRGQISRIRSYTEVIVRKVLDISSEEKVTLGDKKIIKQLKKVSDNNPMLLESIDTIRQYGNDCTHTQNIDEITEEVFKKCTDSLFNLYSYLFISYFKKYKFGENLEILSSFSILPPIIRHITLSHLYENDKENINIIDKLSLAILKAFDKQEALKWLEDRKDLFSKISPISEKRASEIKDKYGEKCLEETISQAPLNIYVDCIDRIRSVADVIEQNGKLYKDFESAKELYEKKGHIDGDSLEAKEFNSIMEFAYLGRKVIKNEKLNNLDKYIVP